MLKNVFRIAKADFLERVRRFSFIVMIAVAMIIIFFAVPNPEAMLSSITINPTEFAQSSDVSWIFFASSVCAGLFFPIIGVAYIRNAIDTDRKYGVIYLIQASNTKKVEYIYGKIISNFLLLFVLWNVLLFGAFIMSIIRFPNSNTPVRMLIIVFFSMLPNILFCSTMAVVLEVLPLFKSKMGNNIGTILFLLLCIISISVSVSGITTYWGHFFDITNILWNIQNVENIVFPISGRHADITILSGGEANINNNHLPILCLNSIEYSEEFMIGKMMLILFCLSVAAAVSFWAFYEKKYVIIKQKKKRMILKDKKIKIRGPVIRELAMRFKNVSFFWKIILLLLWGALFAFKLQTSYGILYPLLCLTGLPLFSDIGCREYKYGMERVLSVSGNIFIKQLFLEWISALIISIIMTLPLVLRFMLENEYQGIGYICFAVFIPSLSALLGEYTKECRVFELIFIIMCYILMNVPEFIISRTLTERCIVIFISGLMLLAASRIRTLEQK